MVISLMLIASDNLMVQSNKQPNNCYNVIHLMGPHGDTPPLLFRVWTTVSSMKFLTLSIRSTLNEKVLPGR